MRSVIEDLIDRKELTRYQVGVLMLCTILNIMDGFDVLSVAAIMPLIRTQWHMSAPMVGVILSAAVAGMTVGALIIAPLADRLGRRPVILIGLILISIATWGSTFSTSPVQMIGWRGLTGIAVGTLMPNINTLVSEFTNARQRPKALVIQALGYPFGGLLGSSTASMVIPWLGWDALFAASGLISTLLLLVALAFLPESILFLEQSGSPNGMAQLNRILRRIGLDPVMKLPTRFTSKSDHGPKGLLAGCQATETVKIVTASFMMQSSFYFFIAWIPGLLAASTSSMKSGVGSAMLMNLGGIAGDLMFAYLTSFYKLRLLSRGFALAALISGLSLAISPALDSLTPGLLFLLGAFLFGSMASLYALCPFVFSKQIRSSGTGLTIGLGRIGGAIGPIAASFIMSVSGHPSYSIVLLALPLLLAASLVQSLKIP